MVVLKEKCTKSFVNSGLIYSLRYLKFLILKMFDPGIQKLRAKKVFFAIPWSFFVLDRKIIIVVIPPKLAKIIGVC